MLMSMTGVQLNASPDCGGEVSSPYNRFADAPKAQGLYNPENEKDACGLAVIATLTKTPSHLIVAQALEALRRLEHRGAVGADDGTGDGAGILTQIPDAFFRAVTGFSLPAAGSYAAGTAFLPQDPTQRTQAIEALEELAREENLEVLGWRELPVNAEHIGPTARGCMPHFAQLFLGTSAEDALSLDARAFRVRKRAQNKFGVYFPRSPAPASSTRACSPPSSSPRSTRI